MLNILYNKLPFLKTKKTKSKYEKLKTKWLKRHTKTRQKLFKKHKAAIAAVSQKIPNTQELTSGALGILMLSAALPASTALAQFTQNTLEPKKEEQTVAVDKKQILLDELKAAVPEQVRLLTAQEEAKLSEILSRNFSMNIKHEIDGKRLNRTYGVIGAEQHLMRYPGDVMSTHLPVEDLKNKFIYSSGMAPGRGAWGYFAKSKAELSQTDVEREKWYIAVQTFLAPNYNGRLNDYRGFFKYRKMLIVNVKTGQAIVTVVGDAGPAQWTGKHLGGSPEVMHNLGFSGGMRKGAVLYFFIDDPDNIVKLGPVEL